MNVGLLLPFAARGGSPRQFFRELREEAIEAEARGFDGCFIGEHHQQEGFTSPLHVLAALSGCTERIALGASVILLPIYHPVRAAEDAALVDVMSGGRLILGIGTGYQPGDFLPFGVPFDERVTRLEEAITVVRGAWAAATFRHQGRHFSIPEVRVLPKPVQQPGPPIWGAAWTAPGLQRVVNSCDGWIIDPVPSLTTVRDAVRRARALAGERRLTVAVIRSAWVAPTSTQAHEQYAQSALRTHGYFFRRGVYRVEHDPWVQHVRSAGDLCWDTVATDRILCGAPDEVRGELERWQADVAPDWMILSMRNGTAPSHPLTMEAIRLMGDEVLPAFPHRSADRT